MSITYTSEGVEKEKIISVAKIDDDTIGSDVSFCFIKLNKRELIMKKAIV